MNSPIDPSVHSMLVVVADNGTGAVLEIIPTDGTDPALELIAGRVTHPEEDVAISLDVVSDAWEDYVADIDADTPFTFHRPLSGPARYLAFTVFPISFVAEADDIDYVGAFASAMERAKEAGR